MKVYDAEKPLFSLHVPKTGGNSFRQQIVRWFGVDKVCFHYRGDNGERPDVNKVGPGVCVHGHFNRMRGIGVLQYYPQADQFIVLLREPFDRFVSQWRYLHFQLEHGVRIPDLDDHPTFVDWLHRRRLATDAGEDVFSFLAQLPQTPISGEPTFGDKFLAVGTTERFDDSLEVIAAVLGFDRPEPAPRVNVNTTGQQPSEFEPHRAYHRIAFPLEYDVYEEATNWLDNAISNISALDGRASFRLPVVRRSPS